MDKGLLKGFAVWARETLLAAVKKRAASYGIREGDTLDGGFAMLSCMIKEKGLDAVTEEAAYTFFIRFVALRYLDAVGISLGDGKGDLRERCQALSRRFPRVFGEIDSALSLLFPEEGEVFERMTAQIPSEEFASAETVGWLYQYYMSRRHEALVDPLYKRAYTKEELPIATQIFTPEWVVRYTLDNSLGRYWLERNPHSRLKERLDYLILPEEGFSSAKDKLLPEEITVIDPCVGTGHFLSYAFDLLMTIYTECGYPERDAAKLILTKNLYGLDIDGRVTRLACFTLLMKAYPYAPEVIEDRTLRLNLYTLVGWDDMAESDVAAFTGGSGALKEEIRRLSARMQAGEECGSLLSADKIDFAPLLARCEEMPDSPLAEMIRGAYCTVCRYRIVVTNPPYMNKYSPKLKAFLRENYAAYKGDLFSAFMMRAFDYCKDDGYIGMMTPNVWMFIKSYEELRRLILSEKSIVTLVQMAKGSFFKEASVDVCAFVLANCRSEKAGEYIALEGFKGDMDLQGEMTRAAAAEKDCAYRYRLDAKRFFDVSGMPIVFDLSEGLRAVFRAGTELGERATARNGMKTGDNDRFLRLWWELDRNRFKTDCRRFSEAVASGVKWFPYNKGGDYRKWYGNNDYAVNWEKGGEEIFSLAKIDGRAVQDYPAALKFVPSLSWSLVTSGKPAFRYKEGNLSDIAGMSLFDEKERLLCDLGLLNSKVAETVLSLISPTVNFQAGDIARVPTLSTVYETPRVRELAEENIALSREDWDAFETSWDFKKHPLL